MRLAQALSNLIVNAIEHGGGETPHREGETEHGGGETPHGGGETEDPEGETMYLVSPRRVKSIVLPGRQGPDGSRYGSVICMPEAMNNAFWKAILDYVGNPGDLDTVLSTLDSVQKDAYKQ